MFSCLSRGFWANIGVFLIIKALKDGGWVPKYPFSIFVAVIWLLPFGLSIGYIARLRHPYIESTDSLMFVHGATAHFFANMNPFFALTIEPINQPLHNNYVVTVYGITQYVHGLIHMC